MLGPMTLSTVVIAFESEQAALRRLEAFGYAADVAAEIAVYLAQSTDLSQVSGEIARELGEEGLQAEFIPVDDLTQRLRDLAPRREETIVWALTDGVRFYRGSAVPALARLEGFARFGSPATAAHLAQDKFASLALAAAAGLTVPPTRLMKGETEIASLGSRLGTAALFVKPNALGAKIGIFADSLCTTEKEAVDRSRRIWDRVPRPGPHPAFRRGRRCARELHRLRRRSSPIRSASSGSPGTRQARPAETFLTMKDNETLSGDEGCSPARAAAFGELRAAAFVPRMIDLRREDDERVRARRRGDRSTRHAALRVSSACGTVFRSTSASTSPGARPFSNSRSAPR